MQSKYWKINIFYSLGRKTADPIQYTNIRDPIGIRFIKPALPEYNLSWPETGAHDGYVRARETPIGKTVTSVRQ